jgi:hypothetical protein
MYDYNALVKVGEFGPDIIPDNGEESQYVRKSHLLIEPTESEVKMFASQLLPQGTMRNVYKKDAVSQVEDMALAYALEFGNPTFLVLVAPRTWMVADPEDFAIIRNGKKATIVNFYLNRLRFCKIEYTTEDQAFESAVNYYKAKGLPVPSDDEIRKHLKAG